MSSTLALIYYPARDIYLDPNEDDLGLDVHPGAWRELRRRADGRKRTIHKGDLQCQGCVAAGRTSQSVYLREIGGRRQVVHHGSKEGPCSSPESDEHKAWKERIVADSERAGFTADVEAIANHRKRRTDVVVHGAPGITLGWEVQLSMASQAQVTRRTNIALRDRLTPSWLTTLTQAPFINRVPWSLAAERTWERILDDRSLRIIGGVYQLHYRKCKDISGICPNSEPNRLTFDCGKWHSHWETLALRAEDFIAKTAAGLYVRTSILGTRGGVARRWTSREDRERYSDAVGQDCVEDALPNRYRLGSGIKAVRPTMDGRGNWNDSPLHERKRDDGATKQKRRARSDGTHVDPRVPVDTLDQAPTTIMHQDVLSEQQRLWLQAALPIPCGNYLGNEQRFCEATPTRQYTQGRRCWNHTPARIVGLPEPCPPV